MDETDAKLLFVLLRAEAERRGYELREEIRDGVTTITFVRPDGSIVCKMQRAVQ